MKKYEIHVQNGLYLEICADRFSIEGPDSTLSGSICFYREEEIIAVVKEWKSFLRKDLNEKDQKREDQKREDQKREEQKREEQKREDQKREEQKKKTCKE